MAVLAAVVLYLGLQAAVVSLDLKGHVLATVPDIGASSGDVSYGDIGAPVTILAYLSATCPHCRRWEETVLPEVRRRLVDTGRVRLVLRAFPLDRASLTGAAIVACVPEPDRASIQARMEEDADHLPLLDARLVAIALGETPSQAAETALCAEDPRLQGAILGTAARAHRLSGVEGTPTFVVGRHVHPGAAGIDVLDHMVTTGR